MRAIYEGNKTLYLPTKEVDGWLISDGGTWLPGRYETEEAARMAFEFGYGVLQKLQDNVNPDGSITIEMLMECKDMGIDL